VAPVDRLGALRQLDPHRRMNRIRFHLVRF
jgi:hypothetical protein